MPDRELSVQSGYNMWETRIYLVYRTLANDDMMRLNINYFAEEAEAQGTVYSLPHFINALNMNDIRADKYLIRCALLKNGKIMKEIGTRY